jgi:hypothetical protein
MCKFGNEQTRVQPPTRELQSPRRLFEPNGQCRIVALA